MFKEDVEGGIRTKVLAELMHHMIGLHGKHQNSSALPDPSGGSKHDPAKVSMHGGVSDIEQKPVKLTGEEPDTNEHGGEGDHVEEHGLGDLFGRKKKSGMTEF